MVSLWPLAHFKFQKVQITAIPLQLMFEHILGEENPKSHDQKGGNQEVH